MARSKRLIYGKNKFMGIALIAMFLSLSFCPLRNTLFAVIAHSINSVPKTSGAHLLNAQDDCKTTALNVITNAQRSNSWHPPLPCCVVSVYLFIAAILFLKCRDTSLNAVDRRPQTVPLYTLNCTFLI